MAMRGSAVADFYEIRRPHRRGRGGTGVRAAQLGSASFGSGAYLNDEFVGRSQAPDRRRRVPRARRRRVREHVLRPTPGDGGWTGVRSARRRDHHRARLGDAVGRVQPRARRSRIPDHPRRRGRGRTPTTASTRFIGRELDGGNDPDPDARKAPGARRTGGGVRHPGAWGSWSRNSITGPLSRIVAGVGGAAEGPVRLPHRHARPRRAGALGQELRAHARVARELRAKT